MKKIIGLVLFVGLIYFGYTLYKDKIENKESPPKFIYEDILHEIGENTVDINSFTIYGKYLNFEGNLPTEEGTYELVLKNNNEEISLKTFTDEFKTSKYINDGINLEQLKIGEYIMLIHNKTNNKYYNLINKTDYHDNKYYTITRNKENNLINFKEETHANSKYWVISIQKEKLPSDVYDIVIDPGHGGVDSGATNGKYRESTFTLEYAKALKEALEKEGFKVKLTREDENAIENYGEGSRTGIPYETKAKLMLSIHLNSAGYTIQKGVEIYRAYQDNNDYAKLLADNIVKYANSVYSNNPENKIMDGVYMRVYSKANIEALKKEAKTLGYEPYDFSDHETYYYFIRETGGIMTHAFSDGRNTKYKENIYRNYNQGTEAYLVELAYISNNSDLNSIINNKDGYINALKESVLSYAEATKKVENTNSNE